MKIGGAAAGIATYEVCVLKMDEPEGYEGEGWLTLVYFPERGRAPPPFWGGSALSAPLRSAPPLSGNYRRVGYVGGFKKDPGGVLREITRACHVYNGCPSRKGLTMNNAAGGFLDNDRSRGLCQIALRRPPEAR